MTVTVTAVAVVVLAAASRATAVSVCDPFAVALVSQLSANGAVVSRNPPIAAPCIELTCSSAILRCSSIARERRWEPEGTDDVRGDDEGVHPKDRADG